MFRIIFLSFFTLLACSDNRSGVKDFALAYAELRISEREYGESETGRIIRSQILQKHGLSADDFENELDNIKKETKNWIKFQKNVVEVIDSIIASQEEQKE